MSPFKKVAVKGGSSKGKEPVIDVDDYSPKTKRTRSPSGVFDLTSSDPMLPFRLMRIISEMLHHYWKDLLINPHFMTLTFQNGLPIRIGITFSSIWMKLMRIW